MAGYWKNRLTIHQTSYRYAFHWVESVLIRSYSVRIFPAFSRIRIENGQMLCSSPYSVRMLENAGKMRTRISPNTDTFYAVFTFLYTVL